jgi:hypothetical protein
MKKLNINLLMMLGIFILSSVGFPAVTHAEGWYAGIGTGLARYSGYNDDVQTVADQYAGAGIFLTGSSAEGGGDFNLLGGFKFNPYLGVEGTYTYLSQATASLSGTPLGVPVVINDTRKASGITLSGIGTYPFNKIFSVYARAGVNFWSANDSGSMTINNANVTGSPWNDSANGTGPVFGGGLNFSWNQNDSVRLGYNVFSKIGDDTNITARDVSVISVDYIYSF